MKINFDTPLTGFDASGSPITLTSAQDAALIFNIFLDTVNPPVKSYQVPAANLTAATTNANGSKHVTVDAEADLKVTLVPGTTYYVAMTDALGNSISTETPVLTVTETATPAPPSNFSAL